jgi:quercetin dioxygenase-like cupin family protein
MKIEPKTFGDLHGSLYSFDEIGDKLPMHNHSKEDTHITFILDGSFRVIGPNWEMIAGPGKFIDWQAGQFHECIALEPNSRFLNIVKGS